jgi:hypothetical protein
MAVQGDSISIRIDSVLVEGIVIYLYIFLVDFSDAVSAEFPDATFHKSIVNHISLRIGPLIREGRKSTMASHFHIHIYYWDKKLTRKLYYSANRLEVISCRPFFTFPTVLYVAQGAIEDVKTHDFLRLNQSTVGIDQNL